jgi:hypothetical protein
MRLAESDDSYPRVVAILNGRWRVIECRDRIQWILQYRNRAKIVTKHAWRGRSYCRIREALIRCCNEHAGQIDPAARTTLQDLPERFPDPSITNSNTPLLEQQEQEAAIEEFQHERDD